MAQKPETVFRRRVQARLDTVPNSWFESIQQKTIGGTPDIIGCVNGYFVALEIKATTSCNPTPLQFLKLQRIANAGGVGLVVNPGNLDKTMLLLLEISRRQNGVETNLETTK